MNVYDKEIFIPATTTNEPLIAYFSRMISQSLSENEIPVRFVVTKSGKEGYNCELGTLVASEEEYPGERHSIFEFRPRTHQNTDTFGVALIIPTGIDCMVGGHSGDAGPIARLLGACCDRLILHPNVVNASDINELPENALYVEGSVLSRLLMGTIGLVPVRSNRLLLLVDLPDDLTIPECYINTLSAARATLGLHGVGVHCLKGTFNSRTVFTPSGRASGIIDNLERLFEAVKQHEGEFDVLALASMIHIPNEKDSIWEYYTQECVNPWGGVEAMLTHTVSHILNCPSAHAPLIENQAMRELDVGLVEPRKAAEAVSWTDLFCILKGLHRSPRIITDPIARQNRGVINAEDISCIVQPIGCLGLPTLAALEQGMIVIAVRENRNMMKNDLTELPFRSDRLFIVDNYLEAAGLLSAIKAGVDPAVIRRPVPPTRLWGFPTNWRETDPRSNQKKDNGDQCER